MTVEPEVQTVVNVLGTLDRGGVETVALDLCRAIPATDTRQIFLTMGDREGRLASQFRAVGALVRRCPVKPKILFPFRLWWCLRQIRPQVVVSHVSVVSGLVLAAAAAAGVPVRIARMSSEGDGRRDTFPRRLQRALLRAMLRRSATDVLGVTAGSLAFAAPRAGDPRYRVLPNGVDVERFARIPGTRNGRQLPPSLLYIGRAAPEKNRGFLLRVHTEAKALCVGTTLTIAGPGGIADLEAVDPAVSANSSVRLAGETDQVEAILADGDVLLLPSLWEGLPGVVLEALAAGIPVLATDLPGLRDLAEEVDGLTLLPLSAGPLVWARRALTLSGLAAGERDRISESVCGSRFTLNSSVAAWSELWTASR
ncbi:MAG: hypothetical protein QOI21_2140 [Actinomycetota bacterium]|jgi:glycosyltransferase involved in cell wall biosynthesis|nr:hypothetical protein [Actinomycetota bacterium]